MFRLSSLTYCVEPVHRVVKVSFLKEIYGSQIFKQGYEIMIFIAILKLLNPHWTK